MTNYLSSFLGKVGRWYLPLALFKKYPTFIKFFSLTPLLPYIMLALTNPVYLLLTDQTNGAGILIIIKRHFDDYIHKKHLSKHILIFGERCISPIISVFQIVLRGKQENPLSRGIGNFDGGIFLLSGGNLTRSDFVHLNLFQS